MEFVPWQSRHFTFIVICSFMWICWQECVLGLVFCLCYFMSINNSLPLINIKLFSFISFITASLKTQYPRWWKIEKYLQRSSIHHTSDYKYFRSSFQYGNIFESVKIESNSSIVSGSLLLLQILSSLPW